MTSNGVVAVILCHFIEFGRFRGPLRKSCWRYTDTFCDRYVAKRIYISFSDIYLWRYSQQIIPSDGVKPRHSPVASENLGCKLILITVGSRIWLFDWYQNRWPWMTLNGIMAVILHYFTEFGSFRSLLSKVVEDTPKLVHQLCTPDALCSPR